MTLTQLEALEERRNIEIRYARFNAALVASILINAHKGDGEAVSPYDFIAGFSEPEDEQAKVRKSIKASVALAFTQMRCKTPEEAQAAKAKMVLNMKANGVDDPEGIIREVFPEL